MNVSRGHDRRFLSVWAIAAGAAAVLALHAIEPVVLAQQQAPPPIWQSDFPQIQSIATKVRAGRDLTPKPWPNGRRVAVALSFDFDAETLFLRSGQLSPQPQSRGEYGARTAMPRILQLLEKQHVPASFFIPVVSAQLHPDQVDAILASPLKHEIGVHGWVHEVLSSLTGTEERDLTKRAVDFWTQRLGHKPAGVRCPSWDFTKDTLPLIREFGFMYDSSLMADDRPYEIVSEGSPTGIVELPVEWILDDFAYYSYDRPSFAYYRMSDNDVYEVYKGEFDKAYEEGTLFLLTMHPQITGHRSRIVVLERLIAYMKTKPGVWFATHEQVAQAAAAKLPH
jgi:peptidoglycan/xylan/chitin deacetylase (PgdA/CDA1 family)